MTAAIT